MKTELRSEGAVLTARPEGPHLDVGTAEAFKAQVAAVMAGKRNLPDRLILDLGSITHLDSAGLGALLSLLKRARRAGVRITLSRVRDEVREVLDLTLISSIFEIEQERA